MKNLVTIIAAIVTISNVALAGTPAAISFNSDDDGRGTHRYVVGDAPTVTRDFVTSVSETQRGDLLTFFLGLCPDCPAITRIEKVGGKSAVVLSLTGTADQLDSVAPIVDRINSGEQNFLLPVKMMTYVPRNRTVPELMEAVKAELSKIGYAYSVGMKIVIEDKPSIIDGFMPGLLSKLDTAAPQYVMNVRVYARISGAGTQSGVDVTAAVEGLMPETVAVGVDTARNEAGNMRTSKRTYAGTVHPRDAYNQMVPRSANSEASLCWEQTVSFCGISKASCGNGTFNCSVIPLVMSAESRKGEFEVKFTPSTITVDGIAVPTGTEACQHAVQDLKQGQGTFSGFRQTVEATNVRGLPLLKDLPIIRTLCGRREVTRFVVDYTVVIDVRPVK